MRRKMIAPVAIFIAIVVVGGMFLYSQRPKSLPQETFPALPPTDNVYPPLQPEPSSPPPQIPPPAEPTSPVMPQSKKKELRESVSFSKELIDILDTFKTLEEFPNLVVPSQPSPGGELKPPPGPVTGGEGEFAIPVKYREKLADVEKALVKVGYIREEEKVANFELVENIQRQQRRFIEFMASQPNDKYYSVPGNKERALRSIDIDIPQVVEARREYFRSLSQEEQKRVLAGFSPTRENIFSRALSLFYPATANAQIYGIWDSYAFCYKSLGPGGRVPGFAIYWYSCNSGLFCSYGCAYEYDCAPFGASCNVPLGCLNLICEAFLHSIANIPVGQYECGCG